MRLWGLLALLAACTTDNLGYRPGDDLSASNDPPTDLAVSDPSDLAVDATSDLRQQADLSGSSDLQPSDLPDLQHPDLQLPDLQHPDLQLPDLQLPDLQLPDLQLPDLQLPDLLQPDLLPACTNEPEEPNDSCPGANLGQLDEGFQFHYSGLLAANGDGDVFTVPLHEVPHIECLNPASPQSFCAEVLLTPATAGQLVTNQTGCGSPSQAASSATNHLVFKWAGACLVNDDRTLVLRIDGPAVCAAYDLNVRFYPVNTVCP